MLLDAVVDFNYGQVEQRYRDLVVVGTAKGYESYSTVKRYGPFLVEFFIDSMDVKSYKTCLSMYSAVGGVPWCMTVDNGRNSPGSNRRSGAAGFGQS